jgi:hypothetical protein
VYENVPLSRKPEFQSGALAGESHEAPHSVVVCCDWLALKSQTTVSPALIVVSQTPASNDGAQK